MASLGEERAANPASEAVRRRRSGSARRGAMVTPVARALSILAAFTPREVWLSNSDLASRSGLPPSTVSRIVRSLVALEYLHYAPANRKYRLAARVLNLGYAAIAHSDVQRLARAYMQAFAEQQHKVQLTLSTCDRLDMVVVESCTNAPRPIALHLCVGARSGLASSPMGWAFLAALPAAERYYLLDNVQRAMQREWPGLQRLSEAIAQVHETGFCTSLGEWVPKVGIVAAPLIIAGHAPLVLACACCATEMRRARVERELGPRLAEMAAALQKETLQ